MVLDITKLIKAAEMINRELNKLPKQEYIRWYGVQPLYQTIQKGGTALAIYPAKAAYLASSSDIEKAKVGKLMQVVCDVFDLEKEWDLIEAYLMECHSTRDPEKLLKRVKEVYGNEG